MDAWGLKKFDSRGLPLPFAALDPILIGRAKAQVRLRFYQSLANGIDNWGAHWVVKHTIRGWRRGLMRTNTSGRVGGEQRSRGATMGSAKGGRRGSRGQNGNFRRDGP